MKDQIARNPLLEDHYAIFGVDLEDQLHAEFSRPINQE